MVAHQPFEKPRKVAATKSNLWTQREIRERGVIDSVRPNFATVPVCTAIEGDSKQTIEIIGDAGAHASWIGFQSAVYWEQTEGENAVYIGAGMEN